MATAEVDSRPQQDRPRRKPFTQWVKNLTSLKNKENGGKKTSTPKPKKSQTNSGPLKNNPYPKSGQHLQERQSMNSSADGHLSFDQRPNGSYGSLPTSAMQERETQSQGARSGAPTLATKAETVHSDAGHSKAATTTTHGGALSSIDGAGADSTFSSPTTSQRSLTTTLTTIQSTGAGNTLQSGAAQPNTNHGLLNNPNPVMFSHQYPVSPAPSTPGDRISAIPRHVADSMPNTYNSATANNLLTDNASILTLASSSKRRRRSMDTDASVRALAPSSVWGGSRESLPLSVLSGNVDPSTTSGNYYTSQSRPSIGGLASAERASVYSSQGVGMASERNSLISHRPAKDLTDAKSLRSITLGDKADSRSLGGDVGSLRGYEGSMRSGKVGHSRNDSIPGSIGGPHVSPRPGQTTVGGLSRRSSDWAEVEAREDEDGDEDKDEREEDGRSRHVEDDDEAKQGLEEHERRSQELKRQDGGEE